MKKQPATSLAQIKISEASHEAIRHLAKSMNISNSEVIESAMEALRERSIPANVLLPFDTTRTLELTASSTRRIGVLLDRLEVLVLTARRQQFQAADRFLAEMDAAPSTQPKPANHEE